MTRFSSSVFFVTSSLVIFSVVAALGQGSGVVIDGCDYGSHAAARSVWKPMQGSAPVETTRVGDKMVLKLPCKFSGGEVERASWDRAVKLDLKDSPGVEFRILCSNSIPVAHFNIYFQSGQGWYGATFFPESSTGWSTIRINKNQVTPEGTPAGWDQIKTIRISAWRANQDDTEFFISDLRRLPPPPPVTLQSQVMDPIERLGELNGFKSYQEATNAIRRLKPGDAGVSVALAEAERARRAALAAVDKADYGVAGAQAKLAQQQMLIAFCRAQKAEPGEFRAFWCHSAFGVQGMNWDEAIQLLATNGFTAIIPNMLWGGAAFYDSKVLPVAKDAQSRGDQIRECLAACRKYGIKMYVWKVDWYLGRFAPKEFVERMRSEGRLQADASGKEEPWLCPSRRENQQLEIAAMMEVARNYDVDGVHFDYIRYPDAEHCFCAGCRERFQKANGVTLSQWPKDVLPGGALRQEWLDWRRSNITKVVKAVAEQAHALKPNFKISAAVFRNWPVDRDLVGQDWKLWCEKGYLDFLCPMDYTPNHQLFENMITQQKMWAGNVPVYPGMGVSASNSQLTPDRVIEQILITRRHQTHGFVIFNYGQTESRELVPLLGMGVTAK